MRIGNSGTICVFLRLIRVDDNMTINSFYRLVQILGVCGCATLLYILILRCAIRKRSRTRIVKGKAHTFVIPFTVELLLKTNSAIGFDSIFEN